MKTLLLLALLAPLGAQAQARVTPCSATTPNNAICVTWAQVTQTVDDMPVLFGVTYRVEQRQGTAAFVGVQTVSTTRAYIQNLAPGAYEFRVITVYASSPVTESIPSNSATATATQAPPKPPIITIAVVIDANRAPVYRIGSTGNLNTTLYGLVPLGRECKEYIATYRGAKFYRVAVLPDELYGTKVASNLAAPCA